MTGPPVGSHGLVAHPRPAAFPFGPPSLAELLDVGSQDYPDRLALIDGDRTWTYRELRDDVLETAGELAPGGFSYWPVESSAELIISVLAGFRSGHGWIASRAPQNLDTSALATSVSAPSIDPQDPAVVAFTSGTTGEPKRVVHSQHSLLLPCLVSIAVEPPQPEERIGTPLDLRIANVMVLGPLSAFARGSTYVVMRRRYATGISQDIAAHGVTRLLAVPTLAYDLAASSEVDPEQLQTLDRVILGGSGGDPDTQQRFFDRFGVRPTLSYGLSEAPTGVVRESLADPIGSRKGHPLPHVEVVIADPETGSERPIGEVGEVCLRSASAGPWAGTWTGTLGYLGQPELTERLFRDGLLHTGDMGATDTEGRISITGRLSQLIIRGGENVDPESIRRALVLDPTVADAHVVGYPDDRLGQRIGAAVVVADGAEFDPGAIQARLAENGPDVSFPDRLVLLEEIPRNQMGKVAGLPDELFTD